MRLGTISHPVNRARILLALMLSGLCMPYVIAAVGMFIGERISEAWALSISTPKMLAIFGFMALGFVCSLLALPALNDAMNRKPRIVAEIGCCIGTCLAGMIFWGVVFVFPLWWNTRMRD